MTPPNDRGDGASTAGRQSLRADIRAGFRRALGLTVLGTAIPGAGLTQTRSRKTGWLLLTLFLLGIAGIAYYVLSHGITTSALSVVTNPTLLRVAPFALVGTGLVWAASIVMTAVQARPARLDRARTRLLAALTTVLVLLVAGTSVKAAEYASITQETVKEVFGTPVTTPGQGAQVVEGEDPWAETPRVNILLLGSDAGVGREGTRTDSMMVASIDTKSGRTTLISLPRNLQRPPLPENSPLRQLYPSGVYGSPVCFREQVDANDQCMLNAIWTEVDDFRRDHPGSYSGKAPGRDETRNVIEEVIGLKIDHMVVIDLKGFQQLIDAMGGVYINVKLSGQGTKLTVGGKVVDGQIVGVKRYLEPGYRRLNGYDALWYARTRAADTDNYRQARQRCVVQAVLKQVNPGLMLRKYPELAQIARNNIYTDIPVQNLAAFADLVERVQKSTINSVSLTANEKIYAGDPNYDRIRSLVQKGIKAPAATPTPEPTPTSGTSTPTKKPSSTPSPTTTPYSQC